MKQRKQGKPKVVWLAREAGGIKWYFISSIKPRRLDDIWANRGVVETFCPDKFERITGLKLNPGECKRVTITVKEVKEAK